MKKLTSFIVIIFSASMLWAQDPVGEYDYYSTEEGAVSDSVNENRALQKLRFGLMSGAGAGTFSGRNSFVNTFMAPYLSYRLSPKVSVNAAAMVGNTQFNYSGEQTYHPSSFNSKSLMIGMDYKISEKATIGAGFQMSQGMMPINNPGGFHQFGMQPLFPGRTSGFMPFSAW